jgi:hypothetical protein
MARFLIPKNTTSIIGIKPAESQLHNYGRSIVIVLLLSLIIYEIYSEKQETDQLDDIGNIGNIIKQDTILYNSVMELEPECRHNYIRYLKSALLKAPPSMAEKYLKNISIAVIVTICSEYIINGNTAKPMGSVGRSIIATAWSTSLM